LMIHRAGPGCWTDEESFVTVWSLLGSPGIAGVLVSAALALAALILGAREVLAADPGATARLRHRFPRGPMSLDDGVGRRRSLPGPGWGRSSSRSVRGEPPCLQSSSLRA